VFSTTEAESSCSSTSRSHHSHDFIHSLLLLFLLRKHTQTHNSEKRTRARCSSISCDDLRQEGCSSSSVASLISHHVEGQLFRTRESLPAYADLATLDARLQILAFSSLHRRQSRNDTAGRKRKRTKTLVSKLGGIGRYRQIQTLLREIRDEQQNFMRNRILGGGCGGCCGGRAASSPTKSTEDDDTQTAIGFVCPLPNSSATTTRLVSLVDDDNDDMPDHVKELYFESQQLLNAFEKMPMEQLAQVDFKSLIARNRAILRNFREWNGELVL
jgi:hypothetical protein